MKAPPPVSNFDCEKGCNSAFNLNPGLCVSLRPYDEGLVVLREWAVAARDGGKSPLLLRVLKCLRRLPVTLEALERSNLGGIVSKLRKYEAPAGGDAVRRCRLDTSG